MQVSKRFTLESAHMLPKHPSKCRRLHGHSWGVEIILDGPINQETQFVLDYAELSQLLEPLISLLDHRHLNLFISYPSSENVAMFFAWHLHRLIDNNAVTRLRVRVSETAKTWCEWDSAHIVDWQTLPRTEGWRSPSFDSMPWVSDMRMVGGAVFTQEELGQLSSLARNTIREVTDYVNLRSEERRVGKECRL